MLYQTYIADGSNTAPSNLYQKGYYSSPLYQVTDNYNTRLYTTQAQPWFVNSYQ